MSTLVHNPTESLVIVPEGNTDYIRISDLIKRHLPDITITRMETIQNTFLGAMYNLKKAEYKVRYGADKVTEEELFHSTRESAAVSIAKDNFDWRKVSRCKYGLGISFSPNADYANCHANRNNGHKRAFILTKVLIAKEVQGQNQLLIPPRDYDTTKDYYNFVKVKFQDNEFLPEYIIYYNDPDYSRSQYMRYC